MARWKQLLGLESPRGSHTQERQHLLPVHNDQTGSPVAPKEVTKVALRLKYLIEQIVPYELDESMITSPNGAIITPEVEQTAKTAACEDDRACVVFCLMVCQQWFKKQAALELYDSELHVARATASEMLAKHLIESEKDQDYLQREVLLRRFSYMRHGDETPRANVIERAVDTHALRVIGASGYQKCIVYLWRGWLVQDDLDPTRFVHYNKRSSTDYWDHFDPDRMRVPQYQNAVQAFFSVLFLIFYSQVINSINQTGDIDVIEGILYIFTLGFILDELVKLWKVGRYYVTFWNVFNLTLYALLTTSFIFRVLALTRSRDSRPHERARYNHLSYNFLAFSAPLFWSRLLLYFDTFRFFGVMLVVVKVMMKESLIFFSLLLLVIVGFLQAFVGMDYVDSDPDATQFIIKAMANTIMASPEFSQFEKFEPPFGIILYYIFNFVVTVVLLNILIALYNSAYSNITERAIGEYMALFSLRTTQFIRAPDENVFIAPLNLIEIVLLVLPFEWWLPKHRYERLNHYVMGVIYSPMLLVTAWIETRQARSVKINRARGEADEDTTEEWEQPFSAEDTVDGGGPLDLEREGWTERVREATPNVSTEAAVLEVRKLGKDLDEMRNLLKRFSEKSAAAKEEKPKTGENETETQQGGE